MKTDFVPFAQCDIGEEEISEVVDVLRSGWLTTGSKAAQFQEEFARYIGRGVQALAVNSATAGLHLCLEAIGIEPGDEVITTTHTFTATAEVIRYLGATPVFVDVHEDTLNISPDAINSAVTRRTKAILPVHFGGLACQMDQILRISATHGLRVIEDAAHALPATSGGRLVGGLESAATVFSFYATKTLATGEGGMIVTRDPALAKRCAVMRLHGIDRDAFDRYTSNAPAWFYKVIAPGFKYNMTDVAAAIGIQQLRKLERFQQRREYLSRRYHEAFRDLCLRRPAFPEVGEMHAWHLYVVRLEDDAPVSRDEFIERMAALGIGTSVHFIPLHFHPYWKQTYSLDPAMFPHSTDAFYRSVSLPIYSRMSDSDQDRVIESVWSILRRAQGNRVVISSRVKQQCNSSVPPT
jgi:dTDP-4-amino-4,6-dideoxygalactose transaminase